MSVKDVMTKNCIMNLQILLKFGISKAAFSYFSGSGRSCNP
jgi:hypothetical protein